MIRRNVSKESSFDIEGASQDTGWPGDDDERRNTASKAWPRILCAIAAGAILLQVAYVMPNRLSSEPVAPTHSAFTADVPLAESEPRKDDGLPRKDDGLQHAERMRKLREEERLRAHMSTKEAAEVRKIETMVGREQAICTDSKIECREWAKHDECSKNWHFMHTECQLSCSLLPGYASAFTCRQPTSAEAADTAKAEEAAKQQSARDTIKAADDAAATAKARARVEAAAAAKKSRAAAEATRAEADAKRKAAADAVKAEADAKQKAAADAAVKAEADAKQKAAADAAVKAEADAAAAAAKNNAADDASPAACVDTSDKCAEWKGMGECDSNPKFMLHTCRKSCGKCELPKECVDLNSRCAEWTGSGECDRNPEFMLKTCRKSCGKCEPSPTSATARL